MRDKKHVLIVCMLVILLTLSTVYAYTDDNTGESFIIETDREIYYGLTEATVYFTVTNIMDSSDTLDIRSKEHTSELQSHSFISYAVFCLKKKKKRQ